MSQYLFIYPRDSSYLMVEIRLLTFYEHFSISRVIIDNNEVR